MCACWTGSFAWGLVSTCCVCEAMLHAHMLQPEVVGAWWSACVLPFWQVGHEDKIASCTILHLCSLCVMGPLVNLLLCFLSKASQYVQECVLALAAMLHSLPAMLQSLTGRPPDSGLALQKRSSKLLMGLARVALRACSAVVFLSVSVLSRAGRRCTCASRQVAKHIRTVTDRQAWQGSLAKQHHAMLVLKDSLATQTHPLSLCPGALVDCSRVL